MTSSRTLAHQRPTPRTALLALSLGLPLLTPGVAFAGGFEYGQSGARAEGRAGAEVAATDSPLALYYNPANLALRDRVQVVVAPSMLFINNCFRREIAELGAGDPYAPVAERDAAVEENGRFFVPEVCDDARPTLVPQLVVSIPIIDRLTIAVGLLAPVGPQVADFGDSDGSIVGSSTVPQGARYMLDKQDIIQVWPTVGVGYAPMDELRFGFAFGAGITRAEFSNFAFSDLLAVVNPGNPDVRNTLHVMDWFAPRITASVGATPVPGLDVGATFTWSGDVDAEGELDLDLPPNALTDAIATPPIDGVRLDSPQNWNIAFGVRYASKLASPVGRVGDRLATEQWDVEVDYVFYGNERVDDFVVDIPDDAELSGGGLTLDLPDSLSLPHRWKNQHAVRIGGDYSAIPGVLGVRAGFSYESNGVQHGYQQLDFQPFRRFGLHVGGTVRIADRFDISLAYAHLFQQDQDILGSYCLNTPDLVNQPVCQQRPTSADPPSAADVSVANAGIIRTSMNILSLELTYTFGGPRETAVESAPEEETVEPTWEPAPAPVDEPMPADEPPPVGGDVPTDDTTVAPTSDPAVDSGW